jgi:DNA-binding transcriptional ArsR family regulator
MINRNIHKKYKISEKTLYKAYALFFGTLTSKHRLKIINALRKKPMNVSELMNKLKLEQTVISHNLKRLKSCGFVNIEKKGKYRLYSLNQDTIVPLMKSIDKHMSKFCIHIVSNNPQRKK